MRTLILGDIHGCLGALDLVLQSAGPADRIITLGDYVDRGPDSRGVLDRLIALKETGVLVALRGNHDIMMVESANTKSTSQWLYHGGKETLQSYFTTEKQDWPRAIPLAHWQFLSTSLVDYHEDGDFFCVHARVESGLDLADQPESALFWEKLEEPLMHHSGKTMICGHTKLDGGLPLRFPGTIAIDTGAYSLDGWLTALEWPSLAYWQANQLGETRTGQL